MSCDVDIVIIGAGVIGLAIASEVARQGREVYILEKNETFGRETSSRNSGTIHTSLLNPQGSWNARLCLEGNRLIYELCQKYLVDYRKVGKILVAQNDSEVRALENLYQRKGEGIEIQRLSRREIKKIEPEVEGRAAFLLPEAGIVDAHGLMRCYLGLAALKGARLACKSEVAGIEKSAEGYCLKIKEPGDVSFLSTRIVINCAGLQSDRIAAMFGIDILRSGYRLNYFKGEYYSLSSGQRKKLGRRLIYPMPRPGGLVGIHTVLDIDGRVRLGPDFYPVIEIDYAIDDSRKQYFYQEARKLFPNIGPDDIEPESSGIMPRTYGRNEKFKDFVIRHELDRGFPGLINIIGIESPGLTASPAIARYVRGLVEEILN
jgi:L-2-hydroxyglutarate oxidase LhgO